MAKARNLLRDDARIPLASNLKISAKNDNNPRNDILECELEFHLARVSPYAQSS